VSNALRFRRKDGTTRAASDICSVTGRGALPRLAGIEGAAATRPFVGSPRVHRAGFA